ncbi:MAG: zinc-ribbon domain-containing protein [Alcaligenaceae bacterium]
MPFCSACGTKCVDDAKFCSSCGKAIVVASATEQPSQPADGMIPAAPVIQVIAPVAPLKAFDNPPELWKMFFYVAFFNLGIYFLTTSATENSNLTSSGIILFFGVYFGLSYVLVKVQAFDKGRAAWLLPLIAFHVWGYLQGISSSGDLEFATTFDNYDTFISGVPEMVILTKLFLVLRQSAAK